jgi:hypothetical protein
MLYLDVVVLAMTFGHAAGPISIIGQATVSS